MLLKKVLYAVSWLIILLVFQVRAQQPNFTLYNFNGIQQSLYVNPCSMPINNINVSFPLLNNYVYLHSSSLRYNDLIYKPSGEDSLVFDMDNALQKMDDENTLLLGLENDLITGGFRIGISSYINLSVIEKFYNRIDYRKDLINFLWNGNGPTMGTSQQFDLKWNFSHYREYGASFMHSFLEKYTAGFKIKYLYGMENINTVRSNISLYTDPTDYALTASGDILLNRSGALKKVMQNFNFGEYVFGKKNTGWAFDLGAEYEVNEKISISGSLLDVGSINWRSDVANYESANPGAQFIYNGINIQSVINDTTSIDEAFNTVLDSAYQTFRIDTAYNAYKTKLPRQAYLNGSYHINDDYQANFTLYSQMNDKKWHKGMSASIQGRVTSLLFMSVSYSIFNKSFSNIGYGISVNTIGGSQWYLISDNVFGLLFPQRNSQVNIRFGLNMRFGKDPFLDDADSDGVPDAEDRCPKVPGPVNLNGCPDRDNDKVADYEDQCPEEFGLTKFKGCPDRDGDNVIDRLDKCPDMPGVPRFQGCPDRDDDGVRDDEDKCPDNKGLPEFQGCPDTDGDGIPDKDDKCPDLFGNRETQGCPQDKDGDGVADSEDLCPDVKGLRENKGCPDADRDGDGTIDRLDKCPDAFGSAASSGCPEISDVEMALLKDAQSNIKFSKGTASLLSSSYASLEKVAGFLKARPELNLQVIVHTDNAISDAEAITLTRERAMSIKDFLNAKQIESGRLILQYLGGSTPIADNNTDEGKAKNNRVEFTVVFR